jgi:hypothetical protein
MESELLTTRELMTKWKINAVKLYQLIENGLPVYLEQGTPDYPNSLMNVGTGKIEDYHSFESRLEQINPRLITLNDLNAPTCQLLFKKLDTDSLEKNSPNLRQTTGIRPGNKTGDKRLRPNQRHKIECRKVAGELWKADPDLSIVEISKRKEIWDACEKEHYTPKTIRNWINDLCPNRNPGRRPKKEN